MRASLQERFEAKIAKVPEAGCWIWMGAVIRWGYGAIGSGRRGQKMLKAHRAAWEIYRGPIPSGMLVLHRCDVPQCVNPHHLFLGDALTNSRDMIRKGRSSRGEKHSAIMRSRNLAGERAGNAKLTNAAAAEIRSLRAQGMTQRALAEQFKVCQATVSLIVNGKIYQ